MEISKASIEFFKAHIFRGVLKRFKWGRYEFTYGKKCELQHHLDGCIEKYTKFGL